MTSMRNNKSRYSNGNKLLCLGTASKTPASCRLPFPKNEPSGMARTNLLPGALAAFRSGVNAALLDSLAQATQFRASEALNFAATMQLMAMPAERQQ